MFDWCSCVRSGCVLARYSLVRLGIPSVEPIEPTVVDSILRRFGFLLLLPPFFFSTRISIFDRMIRRKKEFWICRKSNLFSCRKTNWFFFFNFLPPKFSISKMRSNEAINLFWIERGRTLYEAFDNWKRVYFGSFCINFVVFVGCAFRFFEADLFDFLVPQNVACAVLGVILILYVCIRSQRALPLCHCFISQTCLPLCHVILLPIRLQIQYLVFPIDVWCGRGLWLVLRRFLHPPRMVSAQHCIHGWLFFCPHKSLLRD